MDSNEKSALVRHTSHEQSLHPPVLPSQLVSVDEITGSWQDSESRKMESQILKEDSSSSNALIDRIAHQLRKAKFEFPSIDFVNDISHHCSPTDIDMALRDFFTAYGTLYQVNHEFDKALRAKIAEYESLQKNFNDLVLKKKEFEDKVSKLEAENERERVRTSVLRDENAIREQRLDDKITKLQQSHHATAHDDMLQIQRLEGEIELLKNRHDSELNKLLQQQKKQVAILQSAAEEEKVRAKREYDLWRVEDSKQREEERQQMNHDFLIEKARISSINKSQKETYEAQLAILRKQNSDDRQQMLLENQKEKAEMEKGFGKETTAREYQHKQEIYRMTTEIEKIKEEYDVEKKKMKELHDAEKLALEMKREQENKTLRDDVEALKEALVKRDHFKTLSDHELALRFKDLAKEVDEFARVQWDKGRESNWPFPDTVLRKSENERRTKQHVVQNTIWVILYEKIFCTPFRVLGIEGTSLEREWVEKYGRDPKAIGALAICPKATKDSEKWRYEKMKNILEAISQPLQEWEPNYPLKRHYESTMTEIMEEVSQELERVDSVSSSDKQRMSDLVRKAAKLWLEVGQQRYRTFLLMSDSGGKPSRSGYASLDSDGAQDLVIIPGLRRLGNAQGERLEKEELVSDCKGRFAVFYVK